MLRNAFFSYSERVENENLDVPPVRYRVRACVHRGWGWGREGESERIHFAGGRKDDAHRYSAVVCARAPTRRVFHKRPSSLLLLLCGRSSIMTRALILSGRDDPCPTPPACRQLYDGMFPRLTERKSWTVLQIVRNELRTGSTVHVYI